MTKIKLGLVDSGVSAGCRENLHGECRFVPDDYGGMHRQSVMPDLLGHGGTTCDIILHHAPDIALFNAQVFDARGVTTAATVAAAIDWLVEEDVDLINLSLGLAQDRAVLREACQAAVAAGVTLIASSPAQGAATYPSAYPGVIRATGDARCDPGQVSFLDSIQADFGACPRAVGSAPDQPHRIGGASMGTGHISGQVAAYLGRGGDKTSVREWLVTRADYVHIERRTE